MNIIYLDHNATTPIRPEVIKAMRKVMAAGHANPASQHRPGQQARWVLEHARTRIIELLGGDPHGADGDRLIFTSGGTESNNLAVLGIARKDQETRPAHIIISPVEHASVVGPAERLLDLGWEVDALSVDADGRVIVDRLADLIRPETRLISTILANHETGAVQPVAELVALARKSGILLHTDAVQAVGKMRVDFRKIGVDAMSTSAHKFHGPAGIGALLLRADVVPEPQILGGHQQEGLRAGTESIALAVGMMTALELWQAEQEESMQRMSAQRERFESALKEALPDLVIHSQDTDRLPQTSNVAFPGIDGQVLFTALDTVGVACSIGAACDSTSTEVSPTLRAMGVDRKLITSSLRFSFSTTTTDAELNEATQRIIAAVRRLRD